MQDITFNTLPEAVLNLTKKIENIEKLLSIRGENATKEQTESFLSIQEAAELLNLTVSTLYSKVSRRELKSYKKGKRLYFSSLELLEYIKSGRKKTNAEIEAEADTYLNKNKVAV